ncbi:MAG: VWA domain-containing protein [Candidatus Lokiarchaeota archaeon]|nr:VWA domain-containing protein [Candidatus Lokiarchaeota archaeon]
MMAFFGFFAWIYLSPLNLFFGPWLGVFPPVPLLIVNTAIYVPLIAYTVRKWLRTMQKRKSGPAAGIDVVEPGKAKPEPGDEWGIAKREYSDSEKSQVIGSKSDIRHPPLDLEDTFFVKTPDLDAGEPIFEEEELKRRAMVRSRVTSGAWSRKNRSSRSVGSLQSPEIAQHGRSTRSRIPVGEIQSIDLPASVVAAVTRTGKFSDENHLKITESDLRERIFSGKTPLTILLVIDVSMSIKGSLKHIRKIIQRIEDETRGSKDRVGLIAFKDSGAIEVQAPTTNWNRLYRALLKLRISGLTPLAEGLMKSLQTVKRERMRNRGIQPLVVLLSDFAPNIPLEQSAGPGHPRYTPVRDIIKSTRILKKNDVPVVPINVNRRQAKWSSILKRPYHQALELATHLRMKKEGYSNAIETILSVPAFRKEFGAYLVAKIAGSRALLCSEVTRADSVIDTLLEAAANTPSIQVKNLKQADAYLK